MIGESLHEKLPNVTSGDIASVKSPRAEDLYATLMRGNLALWGYLRTELENIAPQDPAQKARILTLVEGLFRIIESSENRQIAEGLLASTPPEPEVAA